MRLFHTPTVASAIFDEPNLVSAAGLVPVMALARGRHEIRFVEDRRRHGRGVEESHLRDALLEPDNGTPDKSHRPSSEGHSRAPTPTRDPHPSVDPGLVHRLGSATSM